MSVTLDELVASVNRELENKTYHGSAEVTGDGSASLFLVAPVGFTVVEDSVSVTINDEATSEYTFDYDSGICTMNSVPTTAHTIHWEFDYVSFSETIVQSAIQAAVQAMFPAFYVTDVITATSDGETYEFELGDDVEFLTSLEYMGETSDRYYRRKRHRWEVYDDAGTKYLQFYLAPPAGTLRARVIKRPSAITTDLATAGLPERAADPIVSYACYHLLTQKMAPRIRADIAVATQGQGAVFPSQMRYAVESFNLRWQVQLAANRMPPWSSL